MELVARNWWAILIRGIAAILFGILALIWPGTTFIVLTLLFGAYALVDGIFALVAAIRYAEPGTPRSWLLFEGVVGIIAGILAFLFTGIAALALLYLISAWAIVTGIFEIVQAVELRRVIVNEWLLILSGIASVIFGGLLVGLSLRLRALQEQGRGLRPPGSAPSGVA
jgi:uncharacterized membrane protein HdeD (DUF308 family)